MAGVSDTPGFVAPKMAGVSDTPGFVADLGPPKWQVYQIHLALKPILDPQNQTPKSLVAVEGRTAR